MTPDPRPDPEAEARHELAGLAHELRGLIDRTVGAEIPPDTVREVRAALAEIGARLTGFPARATAHPPGLGGADDPASFLPASPVSGPLNPLAPPIRYRRGDGTVEGVARFGAPHEGPPGYVHGAIVAGVFDEILALALLAHGMAGMTRSLTTLYRRPTPLHVEIRFVARPDRVEGRELHAVGEAWAGDVLTARAEGVFVAPDLSRAREYFPGFEPER